MTALTLGDMRAEGVRSVAYDCSCQPLDDTLQVDHLPDAMPVPEVRKHIRCTSCGAEPWRTMPLWKEQGIRPGYPV